MLSCLCLPDVEHLRVARVALLPALVAMLKRRTIVRLSTAVLTLVITIFTRLHSWGYQQAQQDRSAAKQLWPLLAGSPPCVSNPFAGALARPLEESILAAAKWLDLELEGDLVLARSGLYDAYDHGRKSLRCVSGLLSALLLLTRYSKLCRVLSFS